MRLHSAVHRLVRVALLVAALAAISSCQHWRTREEERLRPPCRQSGFVCDRSEECCSGTCHRAAQIGPGNCR